MVLGRTEDEAVTTHPLTSGSVGFSWKATILDRVFGVGSVALHEGQEGSVEMAGGTL